jgi:hypothetical protein
MSGQFQADADALTTFRDNVNALVKTISGDKVLNGYLQSLGSVTSGQAGPLDFGQESVPDFMPARQLASDYDARYDGFTSNVQAFLAALTVLAEAADAIAANYQNATSADQVSATTVQNAIASAAPPQTQGG